jgi:large subunit ribosomal protein L25
LTIGSADDRRPACSTGNQEFFDMTSNTLAATVRSSGGKGASRRLRTEGHMPAVAYGKGMEATSLTVSPKELRRILGGERGLNTVVELSLGDQSIPTLVVDYQVHPVTRAILHADFKKIDLSDPVDVEVPLELTGRSVGVTMGGRLNQVFRSLRVRCRPNDIPVKLTHDITNVAVDQAVLVKDMQLPEGVSVLLPPTRTIAGVFADKRRKEDDKEDGEATAEA